MALSSLSPRWNRGQEFKVVFRLAPGWAALRIGSQQNSHPLMGNTQFLTQGGQDGFCLCQDPAGLFQVQYGRKAPFISAPDKINAAAKAFDVFFRNLYAPFIGFHLKIKRNRLCYN